MSVPAEVLTGVADAMSDGVAIAGMVLLALVAIHAFKLIRGGLLEDGKESASQGEQEFDEDAYDDYYQGQHVGEIGDINAGESMFGSSVYDFSEGDQDAEWEDFDLDAAMKDTEWRTASGWREDESGRYRVVD